MAFTDNKDHYNKMDKILNYISDNFVILNAHGFNPVNVVVRNVGESIIETIRYTNALFRHVYEEPECNENHMRIYKPNQFYLDLKLRLPNITSPKLLASKEHGYGFIKILDWSKIRSSNWNYIADEFESWLDSEHYLLQNKVLHWTCCLIAKSLNAFHSTYSDIYVNSPELNGSSINLTVTYGGFRYGIEINVSFIFDENNWPTAPYRQHTNFQKKHFLAEAKIPKLYNNQGSVRFWKFRFPEQERELLASNSSGKPVFKLLKKLRDTRMHSISNYILKTIVMWQIEEKNRQNYQEYWNHPLGIILLDALVAYKKYLDNNKVPNYWMTGNMLQFTKAETCYNISNFLKHMITVLKFNIETDAYGFAKFLLTENEYRQLVNHFRGTEYECDRHDEEWLEEIKSQDDEVDMDDD